MITQKEGDLIISTVKEIVKDILYTYDIKIESSINAPEEYAILKIKAALIRLRR